MFNIIRSKLLQAGKRQERHVSITLYIHVHSIVKNDRIKRTTLLLTTPLLCNMKTISQTRKRGRLQHYMYI